MLEFIADLFDGDPDESWAFKARRRRRLYRRAFRRAKRTGEFSRMPLHRVLRQSGVPGCRMDNPRPSVAVLLEMFEEQTPPREAVRLSRRVHDCWIRTQLAYERAFKNAGDAEAITAASGSHGQSQQCGRRCVYRESEPQLIEALRQRVAPDDLERWLQQDPPVTR